MCLLWCSATSYPLASGREWPMARPLSAYSLPTSLHISLALERGVLSSNHTGPCWQGCLVVRGPPSGMWLSH